MIIRAVKPNNFRVLSSGFRQQVSIRGNQIRQLHAGLVRIASFTQRVALQIDSILVEGGNREDMDFIAVANSEGRQLLLYLYLSQVDASGNIYTQHSPLFVGFQPLNFNVTQGRRRQNSSRKVEHL